MIEREEIEIIEYDRDDLDAEAYRLIETLANSIRPIPGGLQQMAQEWLRRYAALGGADKSDASRQTDS